MTSPHQRRSRLRAVIVALLTAGALVLGIAPVTAAAQPSPDSGIEHRSASVEVVATTSGQQGRTPVSGIVFSLEQVEGIDLTTQAGLAEATEIIEDHSLLQGRERTVVATLPPTSVTGQAQADHLPIGLYVLSAEEGYRPMVFTLPTADPTDGSWVYHLGITPKPEPAPGEPEPTPIPPQPQPDPPGAGDPDPTVPTPGVPTGELLADGRGPIGLLIAAVAMILGGLSVLIRRRRGPAQH
ncbi:MAG: hypothetical protein Q4G67_11030 [Actinomycetia bacterium]|nr:hypothetical protein [Actinomycetes bacterium]